MNTVEFSDWCMFKLEDSDKDSTCLMCDTVTKTKITALHVVFKRMVMGACCSEVCFAGYKEKYGV